MSQLGAWAAGAFRQNMENKPPLWDIARKGDIDTTPGRRHTHRAGGGDKRVHSIVDTPSKKSVDNL